MKIGFGLLLERCEADILEMASQSFQYSDGTQWVSFSDILSLDLKRLHNVLHNGRTNVKSLRFSPTRHDPLWIYGESCIAGAMLLAGDVQRLEVLGNQFTPRFPAPCHGIVPIRNELHIESAPRGHLIAVGPDHYIYSHEFVELIQASCELEIYDVLLHGRRVFGWHRLLVNNRRQLLSQHTLHNFDCQTCHHDRRGDKGVLLGHFDTGLEICTSAVSLGHTAHSESLLVSLTMCQELEGHFKSGFGLRPIIRESSDEGARVAEILEAFRGSSFPDIH